MGRRQRDRIYELEEVASQCLGALHGMAAAAGGYNAMTNQVIGRLLRAMPELSEVDAAMRRVTNEIITHDKESS